MSLLRKPLVLLTAASISLFAGGCASGDGPSRAEERAAFEEELSKERRRHQAEQAAIRKERDRARDEATGQGREVQRLQRELQASRQTAASHKESLDGALSLLATKSTELNKIKQGNKSAKSVPASAAEAVPLLLAKDRQIKRLRAELIRLKSGEVKPRDEAVDGMIVLSSLDFDVPVARVDGQPITRRDFVEFLYRDIGAPQLLSFYINRYLVVREARRRKIEIAPVDKELWVAQQILLHTQQAGGEGKLEEKLKEQGFTRDAWEARLRFQAEPSLMIKRMVELNRQTPAGQEAFKRRVRAAYDEHHTPRVRARHVLIACPENASPSTAKAAQRKAEAAMRQLKSGAGFDKVARYYSDDKDSRTRGGRLGTFDRKTYAVLPRLNTAFFTLPVGQTSQPIRSRAGFHVVLVDERLPPEQSFTEATRRRLTSRLEKEPPAREEVDALVSKLRSRAQIETALVFD